MIICNSMERVPDPQITKDGIDSFLVLTDIEDNKFYPKEGEIYKILKSGGKIIKIVNGKPVTIKNP